MHGQTHMHLANRVPKNHKNVRVVMHNKAVVQVQYCAQNASPANTCHLAVFSPSSDIM